MPRAHFAVDDRRTAWVRLTDKRARHDPRASYSDRPGGSPMVAAIKMVDRRRAAEFGHDDDERVLPPPAFGQVVNQRRESLVELPNLLQMKIKVLVMGVVVRMRYLYERHAGFEQPSGQQAMSAEVVSTVTFLVARRLLGDVEHLPAPINWRAWSKVVV